jgi:hypothetical protein
MKHILRQKLVLMKFDTMKLVFLCNFMKMMIFFYHITTFCINAVKFAIDIQNDTEKTEQN